MKEEDYHHITVISKSNDKNKKLESKGAFEKTDNSLSISSSKEKLGIKKREHDKAEPEGKDTNDQSKRDNQHKKKRKPQKLITNKASAPLEEAQQKPFDPEKHEQKRTVKNMSGLDEDEAAEYLKTHCIRIFLSENKTQEQKTSYLPFIKFQDTVPFLPPKIIKYCEAFPGPTPIQSQCWPVALDGRDLVGIAETGSGKTLAFGFPAISKVYHLLKNNQGNASRNKDGAHPLVLMMAPTRELAIQIHETLSKSIDFIKDEPKISAVCIYGGASRQDQKTLLLKSLKKTLGPSIMIGTPGRILDFLLEGSIHLDHLKYLVLDEADRMLDLGFEPDIRKILSFASDKTQRQTLMFSATWPSSIRKLASEYLNNPVHVAIVKGEGSPATEGTCNIPAGGILGLKGGSAIHQIVEVIEDHRQKDTRLLALLSKYQNKARDNKIIIFVLYKKEAPMLETLLSNKGHKCGSLHGDKNQSARVKVLESFKSGHIPILIATDVAARGLDIPNVEYVINYTFPLTIEDYVHRIGRTGRAGNSGLSHTLFTPLDKQHAGELAQVLKNSKQIVPQELLKFGPTIKKKEHKDYGAFYKEIDPNIKPKHVKFDDET